MSVSSPKSKSDAKPRERSWSSSRGRLRDSSVNNRVEPRTGAKPLILVRHSIPKIEKSRCAHEWQLSADGVVRAKTLGRQLVPLGTDHIFSSCEPKAAQTASAIAQVLSLDRTEIPELGEHDRRSVPFYDDPEEFRRLVRTMFERPEERVFGGESATEALARFSRGTAEVRRSRSKMPIVVSHGTVISLFLSQQSRRSATSIWEELTMPCAIDTNGRLLL
ncbi:MAG: histidine phosphatase family protein [Myxococcota bacterium]